MVDEQWDGEDRRKEIRRESDRQVCPFHKIKCDAIHENKLAIHSIEEKMATKEDLKEVKDSDDKKAPKWVLILLVTIVVGMFGWIAVKVDVSAEKVSLIKANQDVLLKAFDIKPVKTEKTDPKKK